MNTRPQQLFLVLCSFFVCNVILAELIGVKVFALGPSLGTPPIAWSLFGIQGTLDLTAGVLLWPQRAGDTLRALPIAASVPIGAALGGLAGATGIGGGVFLSPLLILGRFADAKVAGATAACFIFGNSIAGLIAKPEALRAIPDAFALWALAAVVGGAIGSRWGARFGREQLLRRLLAAVLLVAAVKLLWR